MISRNNLCTAAPYQVLLYVKHIYFPGIFYVSRQAGGLLAHSKPAQIQAPAEGRGGCSRPPRYAKYRKYQRGELLRPAGANHNDRDPTFFSFFLSTAGCCCTMFDITAPRAVYRGSRRTVTDDYQALPFVTATGSTFSVWVWAMIPVDLGSRKSQIKQFQNGSNKWMLRRGRTMSSTNSHLLCNPRATRCHDAHYNSSSSSTTSFFV